MSATLSGTSSGPRSPNGLKEGPTVSGHKHKYGVPLVLTQKQVNVRRPEGPNKWAPMDNPLYQAKFPASMKKAIQWESQDRSNFRGHTIRLLSGPSREANPSDLMKTVILPKEITDRPRFEEDIIHSKITDGRPNFKKSSSLDSFIRLGDIGPAVKRPDGCLSDVLVLIFKPCYDALKHFLGKVRLVLKRLNGYLSDVRVLIFEPCYNALKHILGKLCHNTLKHHLGEVGPVSKCLNGCLSNVPVLIFEPCCDALKHLLGEHLLGDVGPALKRLDGYPSDVLVLIFKPCYDTLKYFRRLKEVAWLFLNRLEEAEYLPISIE
ncbi:hypothetical protein B0T24DRAFT_596055 [Lasiosphaeria ovina]|uniref:Uncharacterized protein n=1 Tax=Lasiosphaeria ovina TaxID=92902 RepID=A0AAE0K460_9PEZI|nr:hypothetical protein B0T24DRAFT_596055 [Lasiosphaeria ovina]